MSLESVSRQDQWEGNFRSRVRFEIQLKKKIQFKFEISVRVKITIKLCLHCRGSVKG